MDNTLFDHLVLSIKEAGAIKRDEIQASGGTMLRLPYSRAVAKKNGTNPNRVFRYLHVSKKP